MSRKLGEALRNWLPATLQYVKPYFSPDDIEKGAKWNSEIGKELETSNIGIVCLTQDNTDKPWILFESGALSKCLDKSRVCTLLFNLDTADVKGPLTSFQATRFMREDFKRLIGVINNTGGESKLESSVLDSVFEMWWPKLEKQISEILATHDNGTKRPQRPDRDILEEILQLTRMNAERAHKLPEISPGAIVDLVDGIFDLLYLLERDNRDLSSVFLKRLENPLSYICQKAGVIEKYDRYRMHFDESMRENLCVTKAGKVELEFDEVAKKQRRATRGTSSGIVLA